MRVVNRPLYYLFCTPYAVLLHSFRCCIYIADSCLSFLFCRSFELVLDLVMAGVGDIRMQSNLLFFVGRPQYADSARVYNAMYEVTLRLFRLIDMRRY